MRLALGAALAVVLAAVLIAVVSGGRAPAAVEEPALASVQGPGNAAALRAPDVAPPAPSIARNENAPSTLAERAALEVAAAVGHARLSGLVTTRSGEGLAGARVRVSSFERLDGRPRFSYETTTGEKGEFRFELGVGPEASAGAGQEYLIHASFPGHETATLLTPPMRAGLGVSRDLVLDPRAEALVEVEVLVRDGHGPVLGANTLLFDEVVKDEKTFLVRVDSRVADGTGRVRLGSNELGRKVVVVSARELGFELYRAELHAAVPGRVAHTALLEEGLAIAGIIRSTEGEPLGHVKLRLDPEAELEVEQVLVRSGAGGHFRAEGIAPGMHTLESLFDSDRWSPFRIRVAAGREDLELVLKRPNDPRNSGLHLGEIHGSIHTPPDVELVGLRIEPVPTTDPEALRADVLPNLVSRGAAVLFHSVSIPSSGSTTNTLFIDKDGIVLEALDRGFDFHLTGLEDGDYGVLATHTEASPAFAGPFSIRGGSLVSGVTLALAKPPGLVSGRVLDPEGAPVPDVPLLLTGTGEVSSRRLYAAATAIRRDEERVWGRTDENGFFTLEGVPADLPLVVGAVRSGWKPARSALLHLAPGERVTGLRLTFEVRYW